MALLSIDTARRLADALGLSLDGTWKKIDLPKPYKGSINAAILDQKKIFDEMIIKYSSDKFNKDKVFDHPLYTIISSKLSGTLEYMALAKVQQLIEANSHDLILVDTPPDSNSLDFLDKPNVLANFSEKGVLKWLVKPFHLAQNFGFGRFLSLGEKFMGGVSKVTGVESLRLLSEFLVILQDTITGFDNAGKQIVNTLRSEQCGFFIVSTAKSSSLSHHIFLVLNYLIAVSILMPFCLIN